ncbi:MAG: hypothetical protein ABR881_29235 [Candidatus Sulfotelmatobacter sp.]
MRGERQPVPSLDGYAQHGISLENPPRVRVFELCRFLADVALNSVLATAQERRVSVLPGMTQILQLEAAGSRWTNAIWAVWARAAGLNLMTRVPNCAFFKIADGYSGHTQVLALFDRSGSPDYSAPDAKTSTIDHIAFEIPPAEFADERKRLEALGLEVETTEHAWVHWRSLYVTDPEGNQVELVCYDESV